MQEFCPSQASISASNFQLVTSDFCSRTVPNICAGCQQS